MKKYLYYNVIFFLLTIFVFTNIASAQNGERFVSTAKVIDTVTIKAGLREITLWGIKPIKGQETVISVKAIDILDKLVSKGEVSCKPVAEKFPHILARCLSTNGTDLGLELLNRGLVIVDRRQMADTEFSKIYEDAQTNARLKKIGIWEYLSKESEKERIEKFINKYFSNNSMLTILTGAVFTIFSIIFISLLLIVRAINIQKDEIEKMYYKEHLINSKERSIIISLLKSELEENKHKLEAFISLYKEMLVNVGHCKSNEEARNKIGKSIKEFPILERNSFDLHLDKLSFMNLNVTNKLSKLYRNFIKEETYIDISNKSTKAHIESSIKNSLKKATNVLIDIEKSLRILDLEYVLALDSVNDYKNETGG